MFNPLIIAAKFNFHDELKTTAITLPGARATDEDDS